MKKKSEEQRGTAELIKPSSNMTFRKASIFAATSPGNNVRKDKKQVAKTMTSLASPAERRVEIDHRWTHQSKKVYCNKLIDRQGRDLQHGEQNTEHIATAYPLFFSIDRQNPAVILRIVQVCGFLVPLLIFLHAGILLLSN